MLIRKMYKFEACHCVRDCNSERCKKSFHGHSYVVEVFFKASTPTNYGMVIDFGDLKKIGVAQLFDNFDHSWHFWNKESGEVREFIKTHNQRWIELPFNPTAENYAAFFCAEINTLLQQAKFDGVLDNQEAVCCAVRVHETATGYAEADMEDAACFDTNVVYSPATKES